MNEQKHRRFRVIKASGSALELCNLFHHHGSIVTLIGYEQPNSVLIKAAFLHSINLYFFAICLLKSSSRVYILSIFDALRYVKKNFLFDHKSNQSLGLYKTNFLRYFLQMENKCYVKTDAVNSSNASIF